MGKKNKDCVYWVAVLFVGLALGVVGGLAIAGIAYPIYQSEKWAAWVQAIGSIAAIAGSLWVARSQAKADLQRVIEAQRLAEESKKMAVFALGEAAVDRVKPIKDALDQKDPRSALFGVYHPSVVRSLAGAISAAPIHELGSKEGILALLAIRDQLLFLEESIESFHTNAGKLSSKDRKDLEPHERARYDQSFEGVLKCNVKRHLDQIEKQFQALSTSMGAALNPVS